MLNRWSQNERDRSRGLGPTGTRVESIRLLFYASVLVVSDAMSRKFYWGMQKFLPFILPLRGEVCNFFRYISMKGKVTLMVPFLISRKTPPGRHFGHPLNQRSFDGNEHMRRTNGISFRSKNRGDGWLEQNSRARNCFGLWWD